MNTMTSPPAAKASAAADHPLGDLLRQWRGARRMSQMDLALEAGISTRHLSYVETGKARPSRELVALLAGALDMPMRDRNALLVVAGYAPGYRETPLSDPQMTLVRRAVEFILAQQEPYPAFVANRHWDVLMVNAGLARVFDWLRDGVQPHGNIMRQVFDPADMRPFVENWEEVAGDLIGHLHLEAATDKTSRALLDEVLAYPDLPARWKRRELGRAAAAVDRDLPQGRPPPDLLLDPDHLRRLARHHAGGIAGRVHVPRRRRDGGLLPGAGRGPSLRERSGHRLARGKGVKARKPRRRAPRTSRCGSPGRPCRR
jgi:transcriptional regulator with XRE-family HTH domain